MTALATRLLPLAFAIGALAQGSDAFAQATINLETANGRCVATTDASGLVLVPGSTTLQANGVTLAASQAGACNPAGGASSSFGATVVTSGSQTPGAAFTPSIGSPFYVIWTATSDATTCTLGGNLAGNVTGWTPGTVACSGAACSGSHAVQVTPTASGNHNFAVTCTNASGYAASSAVNVPAPATPAPTPNPITLTVANTNVTAGVPFTVTWPQMQNTNRCVGTGTLNGAAQSNLGDWTSVNTVSTSAQNSRTVTVPATAGTGPLALSLVCWNADNSASATGQLSGITVAAPVVGACPNTIPGSGSTPLTWLKTSGVSYGVYPKQRTNVNVTEWNNVWGYNDTTAATPVAWPGVGGASPVIRQMERNKYLGIHFKTPPAAAAAGQNGSFSNPSLNNSLPIDMAISRTCGDFSADLPTPGCFVSNVPSSDANLLSWKFTTNAPGSWCNLQPDTDYYVNLKYTDPTGTANGCSSGATVCALATASFHN